jgi:hypothetical protein
LVEKPTKEELKRNAALRILARRGIRSSLVLWAEHVGFIPQPHHLLIIDTLEKIERGEIRRALILCPPG